MHLLICFVEKWPIDISIGLGVFSVSGVDGSFFTNRENPDLRLQSYVASSQKNTRSR